jgi:hypothetical protein
LLDSALVDLSQKEWQVVEIPMDTGVYVYRLRAGAQGETRKLVLVR